MVHTKRSCKDFLASQDAATIAAQLRDDQEQARQGYLPSVLARYMPSYSAHLSREVARHLAVKIAPGADGQSLPGSQKAQRELERMQYEGVIKSLKAHIKTMDIEMADDEVLDEPLTLPTPLRSDEIKTAMRVVEFLMSPEVSDPLTPSSTIEELVNSLRWRCGPNGLASEEQGPRKRQRRTRQTCYICRYVIKQCHPEYDRLCRQCGDFNIAESNLSLPENLLLTGKTALVTGGRVKLGYHIALRLLRCGAHVIVSSRYPRDAELRYLAEADADIWRSRLKIVGADFRTARDVFRLVTMVRTYIHASGPSGKLDILINNAAQTLTDSVAEETKALRREDNLRITANDNELLISGDSGYQGQVRGGQLLNWASSMGIESSTQRQRIAGTDASEAGQPQEEDADMMQLTELPIKTSWTQSITEIPYEDVITAYSVNALSVHILICELLPLMQSPKKPNKSESADGSNTNGSSSFQKPSGYIINVSSREGIFENSTSAGHKNGKHVHTNTSKAALNMITETEAWPCWRDRQVAMNTVDPGYMSAAPEFEHQGPCPIGFEDGAGRVLWPIAQGESSSKVVWGRFLKHYGKIDVRVSAGRG